jgi:hypothetical protein
LDGGKGWAASKQNETKIRAKFPKIESHFDDE